MFLNSCSPRNGNSFKSSVISHIADFRSRLFSSTKLLRELVSFERNFILYVKKNVYPPPFFVLGVRGKAYCYPPTSNLDRGPTASSFSCLAVNPGGADRLNSHDSMPLPLLEKKSACHYLTPATYFILFNNS